MLVVSFLRNKHLFQLQVQAFNTAPQPWGESVQRHQGHCLQKESDRSRGVWDFCLGTVRCAGFKWSFCDGMSATQQQMTAGPKKSSGVFYIPVTKLFLACLWKALSGTRENFLLCVFTSHVIKRQKRAAGYLSDACSMTRWQGVVGELVSCWGRGMAGALLQLVPQLGHLRAEWRAKWSRSHCDSFSRKGSGYSLFPWGAVNVSCYQREGVSTREKHNWLMNC